MKIKKNDLISTYAQSVGIEAAKELITKKIHAAALTDKERYTEEEIARICSELAKEGGLIRIITQTFLVQLERKRSEEQTLLLDNIETQIWYLTDIETYGAVNKARADFLGRPKANLEGMNIRDIIRTKDADVYIAGNSEVFEKKKQTRTEQWARNGKGETRLLFITRTPKLDDKGDVEYVICAAEDITERKRAEDRITHLNSVLKAIRTVNQLIVMEKDCDTLLQKVCDTLTEARGYDAAWLGVLSEGDAFATVKGSGFSEDVARFCEHVMEGDHPPCIKNAIAQKDSFVILDKYRECGDCSFKDACVGKEAAIIRVEHANHFYGLLAILRAPDVAVDDEEKGLLEEVAGDISFALHDMAMEEVRKSAEEALREAEEQFRTIVETAPSFLMITDAERNNTYVSPNCEEFTGYTEEELGGGRWWVHEDDTPRAKELFERTFLDGVGGKDFEYKAVKKNGELWYASSSWEPLKDGAGKFKGIVFQTIDVTERKRAEEKLRESEERYRLLAESAQDFIFLIDSDMRIQYTNSFAAEQLGYRPEELIGKYLDVVFPPDLSNSFEHSLQTVFESGEPLHAEGRFIPDKELWLDTQLIPLKKESGETESILGISRDITERKRVEEKIEASLKEKEALLQEIHHRVKNNLQVVSSLLSMQARAAKDEDTVDILTESRNRIDAMALIHTQLYESGNLSAIKMKGFVDKMVRQMFQSYPVRDMKLTPIVNVADYPLPVSIAVPVGLIFNELISNTFKHAFVNRKEGKIEVSLGASGKSISMTVRDDGVGLPEGFDINTTTTLGLHLVKILAEDQLRGKLEVVSDEGASFKIVFEIETLEGN